MNHVVKFERSTKYKLSREQEAQVKEDKKKDRQRRDSRKVGRQVKAIGEEE